MCSGPRSATNTSGNTLSVELEYSGWWRGGDLQSFGTLEMPSCRYCGRNPPLASSSKTLQSRVEWTSSTSRVPRTFPWLRLQSVPRLPRLVSYWNYDEGEPDVPTMKATLSFSHNSLRPRKKAGDACTSPPSEAIGSMMIAATGLFVFLHRNERQLRISPGRN